MSEHVYVFLGADVDRCINNLGRAPHIYTHYNMAAKHYTWKWIWSDHGDTILSSHQLFGTKQLCQLDALKHQPTIQTSEKRGRSGKPHLEVKESPIVQYSWKISIYNDASERIGCYSEERWFDNWVECLDASYHVRVELFDPSFCWEIDFETREKQ